MPRHDRAQRHAATPPGAGEPDHRAPVAALDRVEAEIAEAWAEHRRRHPGGSDAEAARAILHDPSRHPWRLVDAALDHLPCGSCGAGLGAGRRGCAECDEADGFRFAAREIDRPGVPRGNEHAIRVATAVLRAPVRHPAWAVAGNRDQLPLFLDGRMPTRAEQEALLAAWRRGRTFDASGAGTFTELAERARAATRRT